jgi:glucose-1-phosphate thymidylyltransferase
MRGVVLAAGEGTRMRPLTDDKPKPLVEVDGKTVLERCFDSLIDVGVDGFVVVVGYKNEKIIEAYGDEYDGFPVVYAHQDERDGLAHALLQAEQYVENDFMLVHGDNVFASSAYDDLRGVTRSDADATLLVEEVPDDKARNTAVVVMCDDRVVDVVERADNPPSNLSVVGFYSLPPSVFDACRSTEPSERAERELGDALSRLADTCDVRAITLDGERVNVNNVEDIEKAERMLRS